MPSHLDHRPGPGSPWPGSEHLTRHLWQLDAAVDLVDVAQLLDRLAGELTAAHHAGWWLAEPMRGGHLLARRPSRRQRGRSAPVPAVTVAPRPPVVRRRLRVVDEPVTGGVAFLDSVTAPGSPQLRWTGRVLEQTGGPGLPTGGLTELDRQVAPTGLPAERWVLAVARCGSGADLVADGSALRAHAVRDGILVRTVEALTFAHAADGAGSLLEAAAAYRHLARTARCMVSNGGRLVSADGGLVDVAYEETS